MIVAIIIVLFILVLISMYNSLVRKRNQIENAFSTIDVMLKRRFDLIPNLVATVQQYAKHEADTFAAITEMRNKTYTSLNDSEKAEFDKMFSKVRTQFFAVAENYPELKASENFLTDYNNAVQTFPTNLLAGMFGFTRKAVLTIPEAERATPDVKNLFNS